MSALLPNYAFQPTPRFAQPRLNTGVGRREGIWMAKAKMRAIGVRGGRDGYLHRYQVKQVRQVILKYKLGGESEA